MLWSLVKIGNSGAPNRAETRKMVSEEYIKAEYPLHWLVWKNEYKLLEKTLKEKKVR